MTISPDDRVSGQIIAASKPRNADDKGPQFNGGSLPFSEKVAISDYSNNGYVGSQAVFSDLTFDELPQLANMNHDAAGVDISLRQEWMQDFHEVECYDALVAVFGRWNWWSPGPLRRIHSRLRLEEA